MQDKEREGKKKYMRNYYYEGKNLLSHLINCVKELENVYINKQILKMTFGSIKKGRK